MTPVARFGAWLIPDRRSGHRIGNLHRCRRGGNEPGDTRHHSQSDERRHAMTLPRRRFLCLRPLFLALGVGYVFSTRPAAVKVLMNQRSLSARGVATLANGHSVLVRVGMEEDARLGPAAAAVKPSAPLRELLPQMGPKIQKWDQATPPTPRARGIKFRDTVGVLPWTRRTSFEGNPRDPFGWRAPRAPDRGLKERRQ